ncbi:cystinosin homolog isoform X2 [Cimex lectularius]|uniref:Cystinosin n=1 Tax=Cimex lectularius TaxID=79782 RepID=A0A8I6S450_CIMLE|nr:cystinosin homolog isoform X2 [Cimex lectularius]
MWPSLSSVAIFAVIGLSRCYDIKSTVHDEYIKIDENVTLILDVSGDFKPSQGRIHLYTVHKDLVEIVPADLPLNASPPWQFSVKALSPGHDILTLNYTGTDERINVDNAYVRLTLLRSYDLVTASVAIGWIYFVAWSVSFYPQVYENWKRKSVVGLNFDFLALNLIGFLLYSLYNCGLYWIPAIQAEYFNTYPKGLIPVQLNDIFFSLHAALLTVFTIFQCFIYERGEQAVSKVAKGIICLFAVVLGVAIILSWTASISWLQFLNVCGYIKLTITLIKYIPQAYMNFRRKSTVGWSIGNVLLDFTGGVLSMVQMIINADNYDDWNSIFGDVTKFGLGLFSVVFDMFFVLQHYVLYRRTSYAEISGDTVQPEADADAEETQEETVATEQSENQHT